MSEMAAPSPIFLNVQAVQTGIEMAGSEVPRTRHLLSTSAPKRLESRFLGLRRCSMAEDGMGAVQ